MAFRDLFNHYFYGRPNQRDFTQADLPKNRRQLFWEVLRVRWSGLVGLNLLYLVFWLPAIFWTFLNLLQLNRPDMLASEHLGAFLDSLLYSYLLILAPLTALTGPFNVGVSYVLRNWARDEHSFAFSDFKSALKANWKQGLIYGIISGLAPLLVYIAVRFYAGMAHATPLAYLPMAITLIAAVIWFLTAPILPTMIVTYRQSFAGILKNGLLMSLAALPRAFVLRLATLLLPLLLLGCLMIAPAALNWLGPLALVLYAVILVSFNKLIWASHANALCEKYLNPHIEGAGTRIGLRPEEEGEAKK